MRLASADPVMLAVMFTIASPSVASTDSALQQVLAESAKAPLVGFERTVRAEMRANPEKEPAVVVERFVPRDSKGGSWTLISIDGRKPTAKEIEDHQDSSAKAVVPGFHRVHKMLAGPPARRTEAGGKTVYHWTSLAPGAVVTPGGDISDKLAAEATVETVAGKPVLSQMRVFAAQPFKIRGIATMNAFEGISQYRRTESGMPFLTAQTQSSDVKAPFGLGGKRRSQISFRPL